ncbi:ParA family protein [Synechocystis salina]|uniref:ParA family protein n=1 Tax=Synechocystis salina LEGE 00031 TaxID=1828736 RepID=A0ABR9VW71_9SYNC|nr:ParA family protein [Synechocystis salina]MBE9242534.1 ParA family protein [Synechocystis salina LEGE 00041]MBE9255594.1 ParA family protein [Synechocystis salina LEGE 00031]
MKIITITGYKGGVGKSTTAIHLATYFSEFYQTILIDGDPNRTALSWAERGSLPFTVADERQAMKQVSGAEFIVIDTPARPNSDDLKELAKGCDLLVLPTAPDILSLQPMLETAKDVGEANYRALITIALPPPNKDGETMRQDLKEGGIPVFNTIVRRTVGYQRAALEGKPIRDLSDSRLRAAWQDYKKLGKEIQEVIHGR